MKPFDVVGIGLTTLDILIKTAEMPTWEKRTYVDAICFDGGGPAGTALCAAAQLGAKVSFIGTVGNDWFADQKIASLREHGVDTQGIVRRDIPENQVVCVYVNSSTGERIFNPLKNFYHHQLNPDEIERDFITQAAYLHLDSYHKEAAIQAAKWMHAAGKKVVFDGAATTRDQLEQRRLDLVPLTDILICGAGFAEALTGIDDFHQAGFAALNYGPEIVVITRGAEGCYFFSQDEIFHTPAFPVKVVDTTGAGDVFHGAFLVGLLKGWELRKICQFASAAATLECTALGGRLGLPNYLQVEQFLTERNVQL